MLPYQDIEKFHIYNRTFKKEIKETTDRACVIVSVAYLDDILRNLLTNFMTVANENENKLMFEGSNAPFSSFSSKVKVTFRLGLISIWEYNTLENLRKIRNKFAHIVTINSLENDEIKGLVNNIKPEKNWLYPESIYDELKKETIYEIPTIDDTSYRDIFEKSVEYLIGNLFCRGVIAGHKKRREASNITSPLETHSYFIKELNTSIKNHYKNLNKMNSLLNKVTQNINKYLEIREQISSIYKEENNEELQKITVTINEYQNHKTSLEKLIADIEKEIPETILLRDFFIYLNNEIKKTLKIKK